LILITRTAQGNAIERSKLEELGAKVIELAPIKIAPPSSWQKADEAISRLRDFDWVVFTSASGVRAFVERCSEKGYTKVLEQLRSSAKGNPRFATVGPATSRELERFGLRSSFQPDEFLTSSLAKELASQVDMRGKKILLARAEKASKELGEIFEKSGAFVFEVPVYSTVLSSVKASDEIVNSLTDVTFTSPSTVEGLAACLDVEKLKSRPVRIHCIGPVTARAAEARGFKVSSVAKIHTIDGLVRSIVEDAEEKIA
jgi:uroporphyrinogen-III synthase